MGKSAFVVMPYDSKFNRLYSLVIEETLKSKGYTPIGDSYRQDRTGEGGVVMNNVVEKVGKADIVLVVLDSWNWNVAYELGISHALNRAGTILMCTKNDEKGAPFDVKHLNILYYDSEWFKNESEKGIIEELSKRIDRVERGGSCDSPVHTVFAGLPDKVALLTELDQGQQGQRIKELEKENKDLHARLKNAGLDDNKETATDDFEVKIMRAIDDRIYYSDTAVAKLTEYQRAGKIDEFGKFLAQVIKHGFLDEVDCVNIYKLCNRLNVPSLTKVFLEYATKVYPDHEVLNTLFAKELAKIPQTRDQALLIADKMVGLVRKNGKFELTSKHVTIETLAAFMDVYLNLKKYNDILKIVPVLLEEYSKTSTRCLLYRNMATAYMQLEKFDKAEEICKTLLDIDPESDMNSYSAFRLFKQTDRYELAYEALENCIRLDSDDEDYYFFMAELIFEENLARIAPDSPVQHIADSEAKKYAIPFALAGYSVSNNPATADRLRDFLIRNNCNDVLEKLANGDLDELNEEYDASMVEYCRHKQITPLFAEKQS